MNIISHLKAKEIIANIKLHFANSIADSVFYQIPRRNKTMITKKLINSLSQVEMYVDSLVEKNKTSPPTYGSFVYATHPILRKVEYFEVIYVKYSPEIPDGFFVAQENENPKHLIEFTGKDVGVAVFKSEQ